MAEEDTDPESKTEDPTERRKQEARERGQIPFSAELVGTLLLLIGVVALSALGSTIGNTMLDVFRQDLRNPLHGELNTPNAQEIILGVVLRMVAVLVPFFGVLFVISIAASVVQVGFQINPERLEPKLDRLNPVNGFSRLFGLQAVVKGLLAIAKIVALAAIAYVILEGRLGVILSVQKGSLVGAVTTSWTLVMKLATYLSAAVAVVALGDYLYQRYRFMQSIRMTKDEVKREYKQNEGDPEVKHRRRQIAREMLKRKMLAEVPKATVVVTNPTHYAVALRYDEAKDVAPVVVARGYGSMALVIMDLARKNGVPLVERAEVARALYKFTKEGRMIPFPLFSAVAFIIAFVRNLKSANPLERMSGDVVPRESG